MKNHNLNRTVAIGILLLFTTTGLLPLLQAQTPTTHTITDTKTFTTPTTTLDNGDLHVTLTDATGIIPGYGQPQLPDITTFYELPLGSTIQSVTFTPGAIQTQVLSAQVQPVPTPQKIGDNLIPQTIKDETTYRSAEPYPGTWGWYTLGAGINANNKRVLFLAIYLTPIQYRPALSELTSTDSISVTVTYNTGPANAPVKTVYDLVIIAPSNYTSALQPLVDHKIAHGLSTTLVTLDTITATYPGRDLAEKIKYSIKDDIETWNTSYVMLVGDMKKLPIRTTYANWWEPDVLSDLYYADVYNSTGGFCSWDKNNNNRFGETNHDGRDLDGVDLYPDVNLGRLACTNTTEVQTVVGKIIAYETQTYGQEWFKTIVLAGGDTFPQAMGAPRGVYEGEITNSAVAKVIPSFTPKYLWTSHRNLHFWTFNKAINKGAGFVSYAGHGFEMGWGTYRPSAVIKSLIMYYTPYERWLSNSEKLPIMFWDACLTAKLDFNVTNLQHYYPQLTNYLIRSGRVLNDSTINFPCFAWSFIKKTDGGAIGTVGATRTAYTHVDENGIYGGAGYLDVQFFAGYHDGVRLGQMMTSSQVGYINGVGPDYFTLEEFILLGDPSLMVGGISSTP